MAAGEFGKAFWGGAGGAAPGALLGLATMPFQLMEAGRQREFQRSAMEAQLQAANYATQQSAANQLMGLQAQLGENLGARVFGSTVAPDLEQGRQRIARLEQENIIRPKEIASSYDVAKREQDLANSPAAKESLYQNLLNYKRQRGFDVAAPMEGMFGRTAFSGRFTA